ncbi:hypothetical protein Tco_0239678, partial [Tanacetum coccineum]
RVVSSSSSGLGQLPFPTRHLVGDGAGGSFLGHTTHAVPFVLAWNLTTGSHLNDAESFHDMMINLATPVVRTQQSRLNDHQALQQA